ncbi:hypothetical protein L1987_44737 [Smallanthus sonchifolius]|uniref:Uncharacterized protein n=1 Tax=Smallanthus sonchifolius TaxID=185202 RepID=A0ACB9GRC2_9ASTR|nr:hypothetical protein L1987_44737 [Smallanthus sonchifolius]
MVENKVEPVIDPESKTEDQVEPESKTGDQVEPESKTEDQAEQVLCTGLEYEGIDWDGLENIQHNEYEASADQSLHDHEEPTNENIDQWGPSVTNLDGETEAQEIHGPRNEQSPESDPQSPPIQTDVNADNEVESLDEQIDDTEEINIGSNTEDTDHPKERRIRSRPTRLNDYEVKLPPSLSPEH